MVLAEDGSDKSVPMLEKFAKQNDEAFINSDL